MTWHRPIVAWSRWPSNFAMPQGFERRAAGLAPAGINPAAHSRRTAMAEQRRIVTTTPENSETPLDAVRGWVTPTRLFFVRNHFAVPALDADTWRLSIEGCVGKPRRWTWQELTELPERT